jgi:hypothetical protein
MLGWDAREPAVDGLGPELSGADRPGANADLVRHRGHRKRAHRYGNKYFFMMSSFPIAPGENGCCCLRVPTEPAQTKG